MSAEDLMTPNPVTVTPQARVAEVWDVMRELEIRHVPVVDDGVLVGMLSDRDLARFDITQLLTIDGADTLRQHLAMPVVKIMSSDVIAIDPETELDEIVELLVEHRIGAIPVIRSGTREVVGIVSYIDVLRALQASLEA